jgi:hypothetical protein
MGTVPWQESVPTGSMQHRELLKWHCWFPLQHVHHVWSSRSPPVRERHPATGGARPLQVHRRCHGAGPLDAAGDLVANGWPRPVDADGT